MIDFSKLNKMYVMFENDTGAEIDNKRYVLHITKYYTNVKTFENIKEFSIKGEGVECNVEFNFNNHTRGEDIKKLPFEIHSDPGKWFETDSEIEKHNILTDIRNSLPYSKLSVDMQDVLYDLIGGELRRVEGRTTEKTVTDVIDYIENDCMVLMPTEAFFDKDGNKISKKEYGLKLIKYLSKELRKKFE